MTQAGRTTVGPTSAPDGARSLGGSVEPAEEVVLFGSASTLVGIVTTPRGGAVDATRPGVILLNAGLLHRIGPNRLHVELARRLAATGLVALRFDFSGVGDSDVRADDLPFWESTIVEAREAMDFLQRTRGLQRFVLMGLCSGAVNSFHTAHVDPRAIGVVLLDPWGYTAESRSLATSHLYWQSVWSVVRSPRRWMDSIPRHLDFGIMLRHLQRTLKRQQPDASIQAQFGAVIRRGVELLLLFSSAEYRGRYELDLMVGDQLNQWTKSGQVTFENLRDATHTFHSLAHQTALLDTIGRWMERFR
jgi:hypothetical protein